MLRSRVESSVTNADSRLLLDHSSSKSAIHDQRTHVTETVSSFTESMQQMDDKLQLQSEDIDHFLSTELKQDMPTGSSLSAAQCSSYLSPSLCTFMIHG